jgi:hypothetical protein
MKFKESKICVQATRLFTKKKKSKIFVKKNVRSIYIKKKKKYKTKY